MRLNNRDNLIKLIIEFIASVSKPRIMRLIIYQLLLKTQFEKEIKKVLFLIFNLFEYRKMIRQCVIMLKFIYEN
jgi:hypothetical protein